MGKFLKILLGLVGLLLVLVVAAAIIVPMVVDPNDYKDEITAAVEKQTGRTLSIQGDIGLSVFPWLGLDIGATQISNAEGFKSPFMASMEAVEVRVLLLPLLSKQVEIGTLKLAGLELNLEKDATGRTNWDDLQQAADEKDEEADAEDGEVEGVEHLAVGGIEVSGAQLSWDDRAAGTRYEINDLNFTTGTIAEGESFDLDLNFKMAATEPAMTGQFSLTGGVALGDELQSVDIADAVLGLDASGDSLPGGQVTLSLASDIAVDLEAQTLSLPEVVLKAFGLTITGQASGSGISSEQPEFSGVLAVDEFSPREVIKAMGQEVPVTADTAALTRANANLSWQASKNYFSVQQLTMGLDETTISGVAKVSQFDAPAITFDLNIDQMNLDRYLPPVTEGADQSDATGSQATDEVKADELPLETLRALNLDGSLKIGKLQAYNLKSTDVVVKVKAKDGVLNVNPANANLYQGSVKGNVTLNVKQDTPKVVINQTVADIQAGQLLKDLTGKDTLTGKTNMTAKLTATGSQPDAIKRTLNGNTSFSLTDGAVKGVNIAALIRNAQAKLQGKTVPPDDQPNQTDFAEMSGTATISQGLVKNNDLSMKSPLLRVTGAGQTSLPEETIDYTLTTKIVGTLQGQGGKGLAELQGVNIPVHIGGTYSQPTYRPDLGAALQEAAKAQVEEKVEEQKQKLQEKIGDDVSDKLLKGLFK